MIRRGQIPLTAKIRVKLAPYSLTGGRIHEAIFASALPRVAVRGVRRSEHPAAPGLQRAVKAIYGRGIAPEEARWVERIERLRTEFGREGAASRSKWPTPGTRIAGSRYHLASWHASGASTAHGEPS